jgi:hypothetical protein
MARRSETSAHWFPFAAAIPTRVSWSESLVNVAGQFTELDKFEIIFKRTFGQTGQGPFLYRCSRMVAGKKRT